jgi:hypothetical protein
VVLIYIHIVDVNILTVALFFLRFLPQVALEEIKRTSLKRLFGDRGLALTSPIATKSAGMSMENSNSSLQEFAEIEIPAMLGCMISIAIVVQEVPLGSVRKLDLSTSSANAGSSMAP